MIWRYVNKLHEFSLFMEHITVYWHPQVLPSFRSIGKPFVHKGESGNSLSALNNLPTETASASKSLSSLSQKNLIYSHLEFFIDDRPLGDYIKSLPECSSSYSWYTEEFEKSRDLH